MLLEQMQKTKHENESGLNGIQTRDWPFEVYADAVLYRPSDLASQLGSALARGKN